MRGAAVTKPVLLAGLLGGLLGGIGGALLSRTVPEKGKPADDVAQTALIAPGARDRADDLIAKLRAGKTDDFFTAIRAAFVNRPNDEQFAQFRQTVNGLRQKFAADLGGAVDLEFARETALGPSLVQFIYVEKYERGCAAWCVTCYHTPNGWRVLAFGYKPLESVFGTVN